MADPTITTLLVRDESGATQDVATVSQGGALFAAHVLYAWDGATLHPLSIDSSSRLVIQGAETAGATPVGGGLRIMGSDGTDARDVLLDTSGRPILGPSAQVIGKVGIDQTTPGATNGIVVNQAPWQRYGVVTGSFSPGSAGSAYGLDTALGSLQTVALGIGAGTPFLLDEISFQINGGSLAGGFNAFIVAFNAALSGGSTWTDASAVTIANADMAKRIDSLALNATLLTNQILASSPAVTSFGKYATTDGSGDMYFGIMSTANSLASWTAASATVGWRLQFRY